MLFPRQAAVQEAAAQSVGFDTDTQLTETTAKAFVQAGFTFAIRYVSLGAGEASGDLSAGEASTILAAGLALMAVQHVPEPGWYPTEDLGTTYGTNAVGNARDTDLPSGMSLWMDLEGVAQGTPASTVEAYCNAWCSAVSDGGYAPGIYVGYDAILTGCELDDLQAQYFWKSGGSVPYPGKGFCMTQDINSAYVLQGVSYDRDVIQEDNLGQTPSWACTPQAGSWKRRSASGSTATTATDSSPTSVPAPSKGRAPLAIVVLLLVYLLGAVTGPKVIPAMKNFYTAHAGAIKSYYKSRRSAKPVSAPDTPAR